MDHALAGGSAGPASFEIVRDDPRWCAKIFDLLKNDRAPHGPYWDHEYASYLGRHGYRVPKVIAHLRGSARPNWSLLISLALTGPRDQPQPVADVSGTQQAVLEAQKQAQVPVLGEVVRQLVALVTSADMVSNGGPARPSNRNLGLTPQQATADATSGRNSTTLSTARPLFAPVNGDV